MKAKTFENLIRKIVREEIDYSLRREIKSLKEDIRDEIKPIIKEQHTNPPIPEEIKTSLKERIMGKSPMKKQNFVKNNTLNNLINETAQGDTNTQTAMAPVTEAMPSEIANVVNRD